MSVAELTPAEIRRIWGEVEKAPFRREGFQQILATEGEWNGFEPGTAKTEIFNQLAAAYPGGEFALLSDLPNAAQQAAPAPDRTVPFTAIHPEQAAPDAALAAFDRMALENTTRLEPVGTPSAKRTVFRVDSKASAGKTKPKGNVQAAFDLAKQRMMNRPKAAPVGYEDDTVRASAATMRDTEERIGKHEAATREVQLKESLEKAHLSLAATKGRLEQVESERDAAIAELESARSAHEVEVTSLKERQDGTGKAALIPIASLLGITTGMLTTDALSESIRSRIEEDAASRERMSLELGEARSAADAAKDEVRRQTARMARVEAQNSLLQNRLDGMAQEKDTLLASMDGLKAEVEQGKQALAQVEDNKRYYEETIASLEEKAREKTRRIDALGEQLQTAIDERAAMAGKLDSALAAAAQQEDAAQDMENAKIVFGTAYLGFDREVKRLEEAIADERAISEHREREIEVLSAEKQAALEMLTHVEEQTERKVDDARRALITSLCVEMSIPVPEARETVQEMVAEVAKAVRQSNAAAISQSFDTGYVEAIEMARSMGVAIPDAAIAAKPDGPAEHAPAPSPSFGRELAGVDAMDVAAEALVPAADIAKRALEAVAQPIAVGAGAAAMEAARTAAR